MAVSVDGTDDTAVGVPADALPASGGPERRGPGLRALGLRALPAIRAALTPAPGSPWRDPVIWAVAALVFGAYFVISLFRLLQLTPGSYDLAIYVEYVKQLAGLHAPVVDILGPGFNLLGNHFQVALAVLAPFFRLVPSPATLLFFQALFTAVSIFPVTAAATVLTGRGTGRLIGFAYGLSWGLQQMIIFDFHEIALAVPLLAFSVSALVRRRPAAAIAWAVPLVFVKEDQGFTVAAIGVVLGATMAFKPVIPALRWGNSRLALWGGLALVAWGLFWSAFAIIVIIPHFNPLHQYYFWGDGGTVGTGNAFSPFGLIKQAGGGWSVKGPTLVMLLLPTVFAALGSPVALIAVPSLVLRFISTNSLFWGTSFHYDATVMPILFIAAAEAIARWRRSPAFISPGLAWSLSPAGTPITGVPAPPRRRPPALGNPPPRNTVPGNTVPGNTVFGYPVLGHRVLGYPAFRYPARRIRDLVAAAKAGVARHGAPMMAAVAVTLCFMFPVSNLWHGSTYQLDAHVAAADAAMAVVPDGATVQTNLDLLAPLAARTDTFWLGTKGNPLTQFIVFDGDNSGYSPPVTNVPQFIKQMYPTGGYVKVFDRDNVYVYERLPGP